jgi:hypothetical protein
LTAMPHIRHHTDRFQGSTSVGRAGNDSFVDPGAK